MSIFTKSLLVVQVGDFGLSRLKHDTFLKTTSGAGTVTSKFICGGVMVDLFFWVPG